MKRDPNLDEDEQYVEETEVCEETDATWDGDEYVSDDDPLDCFFDDDENDLFDDEAYVEDYDDDCY